MYNRRFGKCTTRFWAGFVKTGRKQELFKSMFNVGPICENSLSKVLPRCF